MQLIGLSVSGIAYIHIEAHLLGATLLGSIPGQGLAAPERLVPIVCVLNRKGGNASPQDHVYEPYLTITGRRR